MQFSILNCKMKSGFNQKQHGLIQKHKLCSEMLPLAGVKKVWEKKIITLFNIHLYLPRLLNLWRNLRSCEKCLSDVLTTSTERIERDKSEPSAKQGKMLFKHRRRKQKTGKTW